jgi:hypothetical protein
VVATGGPTARAFGLSRGARIGLGIGLPVAAGLIAGRIENPYLSTAVGVGGIAAGAALSTTKGAAFAARALPYLANPYVAGTAAIGAGLYAGSKINQNFSAGGFGAKDSNNLVISATQSRNFSTAKLVEAKLRRGDTAESIEKIVQQQLDATLKDRGKVTGILSSISGEGPQRDALDKAAEELRQILASIRGQVNEREENKKANEVAEQQYNEQKEFNDKFLKAITENTDAKSGKLPVNLKLFVSFEGDKMNSRLYSDTASTTDTTNLKTRVERLERSLNLTPEPAKI